LALYTRIDVLKPIVLIGTFALAMAFAGNDLVNFIGVPLAGLNAYHIASASQEPLSVAMDALQKPIQSNTFLLLIAGAIMVVTLWVSRKARTVTKTEVSLGRQEEGMERFSSSALSRSIVRVSHAAFSLLKKLTPAPARKTIYQRLNPGTHKLTPSTDGEMPAFDLLRASVNLFVASAVVSFATSLKLPLSTTYVTFMVAMGASLSDQAWGRESAVYRVTGVLTVISGWFLTALIAFSVSLLFAFPIYYFRLPAVLGLVLLLITIVAHTHRLHFRREQERDEIKALSLLDVRHPHAAINTSFDQTGCFLKEISDSLDHCFDAAISEDRQRLRDATTWTDRIQNQANIIIVNIFETLFLLRENAVDSTQKYAKTIRFIQGIAQNYRHMIMHSCEHFENYHTGFSDVQKEELRRIKTYITRLLWNAAIMLRQRKKVDHDYIANQSQKLSNLVAEFDRNEIRRIQSAESKRRLSILYYELMEYSLELAEQTRDLLDIFRESFQINHAT
jgi:phosphate/sulfate permease